MKQDKNGKWKATFDSPECVSALQYIKDLRWKYNVIPETSFATGTEQQKYFGTDQAAMFIGTPPQDELVSIYNMNPNDICIASLPKGPGGRYAQVGGALNVIKSGSTDEQIEAAIKWVGCSTTGAHQYDDDVKLTMEESYKVRSGKGLPIGFYQFSPWSDSAERTEYEKGIVDKYANIDAINVKEFNNPPSDLKLKPEEPVSCQELYAVLDACIQEVVTNKNSDPAALIKKAAKDFQRATWIRQNKGKNRQGRLRERPPRQRKTLRFGSGCTSARFFTFSHEDIHNTERKFAMKKKKMHTGTLGRLKSDVSAYWLILPSLLCLLLIVWRPIFTGMYLSLFKLQGYTPVSFAGLENYRNVPNETLFNTTLANTFKYVGYSLVVGFVPPIFFAIMINEIRYMKSFVKFSIYFPSICPAIITSLMWTLNL